MSRNRFPSASQNGRSPSSAAPALTNQEQELIEHLSSRYDKLNALWKNAEEQLRQFMVPVEVEYCYRSYIDVEDPVALQHNVKTDEFLGWVKWCGSWRLCFGIADDSCGAPPHWKPVTDCTIDRRMECIPHFAKLRKMVVEKAKATVPQLDTAIADLAAML